MLGRVSIDLGDQPFKCSLLTPESKKKKSIHGQILRQHVLAL